MIFSSKITKSYRINVDFVEVYIVEYYIKINYTTIARWNNV